MYYKKLLDQVAPARQRFVASRLIALRKALAAEIPPKVVNDSVRVATWNIREFGKNGKGAERLPESLLYIGEILSRFDLIAIQEVRDLYDLERLRDALGSWWKFIYTDVTEGVSGNCERLTFLYDSRVVAFDCLAGEIVVPPAKGKQILQFARTPYVCSFKAGWKRFELCTVHIYYGESKPDDPRRLKEIQSLAKLLERRAADSNASRDPHTIVLGDFNIFAHEDKSYEALTSANFMVPEALQSIPGSNVPRNKRYDQIAIYQNDRRLEVRQAGVFDFYKHVFRSPPGHATADDAPRYPEATSKFTEWRTFEMSDHLPMWVELGIDSADDYLRFRAMPPKEEPIEAAEAVVKRAARKVAKKKPTKKRTPA